MRRRANLGVESDIVRSWPNRISFRTYSKDEIIKLSVKEITECDLVYEDRVEGKKSAQLNGLHDPALGPLNRYFSFDLAFTACVDNLSQGLLFGLLVKELYFF